MSWIWVDTETNGLEKWAVLLEVAVVVTDPALNIVAEGTWVCKPQRSVAELFDVSSQVVQEMHTKNGLWNDVAQADMSYKEVQRAICSMIYEAGVDHNTLPMAGSTIGFDRNVLRKFMPDVDRYAHYRSVDVSTLKELCKAWNPEVYKDRPDKIDEDKTHRALDDIKTSVETLRYYQERFLVCSA